MWPGWKGSGRRWWEVGRTTPHGPWWPWCVVGTYGESTRESQKDIYTVQDQTGFLEGEGRLVFRQNSPLCTGLVLRGNPSAQLPGPREAHAGLLPASWARPTPAAVSPSSSAQIRRRIARRHSATRVSSTAFDLYPTEIKPIPN